MSGIAYESKMSDAEGLMWRVEKDPHLSSTFGNLSFLDRAPDFDAFRRRLERAAMVIPRLRQVVRSSPGNIAPPTWVDDSEFAIDSHLRRFALPAPADERAVLDLAAAIVAEPFDRQRPLWQFTLVEGLIDGRAALIQKMHHAIADGESGVQLALQFLDFERDAAPPAMPDADTVDAATEQASVGDTDPVEVVRELLAATLRVPVGVARQVRDLLADPAQIPAAGAAAADTLRGIAGQLGDVDGARSPLWTERSLRRRLEITSAPFQSTKAAANALGGTLNTAFMTIATDAVSRYHRELGAPVDDLRASMAISTRTADSGANAFTLVRMLVPTGELAIDERFRVIHETIDTAVEASRSATLDSLAALASTLPTSVVTRLARQQAQTIDFATSNVKGSPLPVYVAGAKLMSNHAVGPLGGVAFNLTLLSYDGRLDMGVNTDRAAVTEPEMLRRFIDEAVGDLVAFAD
ncbi:wax ester/triacylglycerol synthase domain-containing protein [Ilumatobacter nonamiensis]|uniref:wax ester/triacylglycerol synthase domain-containing protein n=1 Tax=Ilumatobacter nonamiensis TaxID=467093 RepID=UPI00034BCFD1|nr:wax ester/triacylglycerol synthase domain-containing protein [Ilumatobacter nonamiensis]